MKRATSHLHHDPAVTEMDRIRASRSSLGVGLAFLITIIVFLIIVTAVDLSCYYLYDCGLTRFVCVKFCNKERSEGKEGSGGDGQQQQQPQQEHLLEKQQKIHLQLCDQQLQTTAVESSHCNVQTSSSFTDEGIQASQDSCHLASTADNYECKPDRRSVLSQGDERWKDVVDELEKELKSKLSERKQTEGVKSKELVKRLSALERQPQHVVNSGLGGHNGYCNVVSESGFVSEKNTPESLLNLDATNLMESGMGRRGVGGGGGGGRQGVEENLIAIRDEGNKSVEIKLVDIGENVYGRGGGGRDEEEEGEDERMVKNFLEDLNKNQKSDDFSFHSFHNKPPPPPPPHLSSYQVDYRKGPSNARQKSYMPPPLVDDPLIEMGSPSYSTALNPRASPKQVSFDEAKIIIVDEVERKF